MTDKRLTFPSSNLYTMAPDVIQSCDQQTAGERPTLVPVRLTIEGNGCPSKAQHDQLCHCPPQQGLLVQRGEVLKSSNFALGPLEHGSDSEAKRVQYFFHFCLREVL